MRCVILFVLVLSLYVYFLFALYLSKIVKQTMQRMLYNVVIISLFVLLTEFILKIQVFWHGTLFQVSSSWHFRGL